jgi:hypothetical protein
MQKRKMWVVSVDKNGNELGDGKWEDIPVVDSFAKNGFSHLKLYIEKLMQSPKEFSALIISTPNDRTGVGVWKRDGIFRLDIAVNWRSEPELETTVRDFLNSRAVPLVEDYLAGNGNVPDATRILHYDLPQDTDEITSLVRDFLKQVYGLRDEDALNFIFQDS